MTKSLVLLILALAAHQPGWVKAQAYIRNGAEFARAFESPEIDTLWLMNDVRVDESDFAYRPVELQRNITVLPGLPVGQKPPILCVTMKTGAVRLGKGVSITAKGLILAQTRRGLGTLSPGFEMLVPSRNDTGAAVVMTECLIVHSVCLPWALQLETLTNATRPAAFPGQQSMGPLLPQPANCSNSSSAPLLQHCWPRYGLYEDLALRGMDVNDMGQLSSSNYSMRVIQSRFICRLVMPSECVQTLGTVGCFLYMFSLNPEMSSDEPCATSQAQAVPASANRSRSDLSSARLLSIVLPSVLGGVGVLFAMVGWLVWRRHTRERKSPSSEEGVDVHGVHLVLDHTSGNATGPALCKGPLDQTPESTTANPSTELPPSAPSDARRLNDKLDEQRRLAIATACWMSDAPVLVTPLTPHRSDVKLDLQCDTEVELLPVVRGQGCFGRVVEGMYAGQRVAVKLVPDVSQMSGSPESALKTFMQEVEVLGRCAHPNVVRLLAACMKPPRLCIVMELMETSLDRVLHSKGPGEHCLLPLEKVLHIGTEVARALDYLHPTIVHRDLKPGNVLLQDTSGQRPIVKLSDFGLSRLRSTVLVTLHPEAGTPAYMAPELYDINNNTVTDKTDIFSLGVLLWEMLTGLVPWAGCDALVVAYAITINKSRLSLAGIPPGRCPPKLLALIERLWEHDPLRRPAAAEVVKHLALIQQQSHQQ